MPREPTTSIEAPDPASVIARAGDPLSPSTSIRMSGATAVARWVAAARPRSRSLTTVSATVGTPDAVWCSAIRGGSAAAETIRSARPRSWASGAAQSTARSDSSEPSVAATIGPAVIVNLHADPGRAGVNREVRCPQDSRRLAGTNRVPGPRRDHGPRLWRPSRGGGGRLSDGRLGRDRLLVKGEDEPAHSNFSWGSLNRDVQLT